MSQMLNIKENSNRFRRLKAGLFGDPSGKIKTFAIISAENPLGWENSTEEEFKNKYLEWTADPKKYNRESIEDIKSSVLLHRIEKTGNDALKYGGFKYVPLKGKYGDLERSFIIFNLTLSDANIIARDYGQESFFFANVAEDKSTIAYYKTYNACKSYKLIEVSETITDESEAEDYFSKFGLKFRINMREFGDEIPEIVDIEAFEESFNEETRDFSARALKRRQAYAKPQNLDEGYTDLIQYMATGNKKKLSKKRKNQKRALSFFGSWGNPAYNADFFNHVMGSDGGNFGAVNGTDMITGEVSGSSAPAGGGEVSGGGLSEALILDESLAEEFQVHTNLNPDFFDLDTQKIKEEVRSQLLKIAFLFIDSILEKEIPLSVKDIILIGSNVAYNYTEYSDLDLHILVDESIVKDKKVLSTLYDYIKADFNTKYDIQLFGRNVEVYLQDIYEENASAGVYSLLTDEWLKIPTPPEKEEIYKIEQKQVFKDWLSRYENLNDYEIEDFVKDLYELRKHSLKTDGEFSDGNLIFKEFRNRGYLQDLKDRKYARKSKELTIESKLAATESGKLIIEGIEINPGVNPKIIKEKPEWFFNVEGVKKQLETLDIPKNTTVVVNSFSEGFVIEIYKIRQRDNQEVQVWESDIIKAEQLSDYQLEIIKKYIGNEI